tara:strand:- start:16783 stop:18084 length:1302 start_codon:yes stop_codon:yes gene_type:complete
MKNSLCKKIKNREAVIAVVGLGYVGLPLCIRFSEENFKTIGLDIDKKKIKKLKNKSSYITHISNNKIASIHKNGFFPTDNFSEVAISDVVIICVPTPLGPHNEPDLSFIKSTLSQISPHLTQDTLLILESTTYPGTTEEEIIPFIQELGYEIGKDFFVGYSPEREDPGNKKFSTKNIPKIVSGYTERCLETTRNLYSAIVDETVPVSMMRVAEMTKIFENIHRAVNIGLVNELKIVSDKMGIDIYEVIAAAKTKPFGFTPYYPGPGLGGHCIPIDPFYLTWKAKELGMSTRFIELAGEVNTSMPDFVITKIIESLNNIGKAVKGSSILVLGLGYKKNVDDLRESPSLKILQTLIRLEAKVQFSDPYINDIPDLRNYDFKLSGIALDKNSLNKSDLVVLVTDHDDFDYDLIEKESKIIIDTRGKFINSNKIIRA